MDGALREHQGERLGVAEQTVGKAADFKDDLVRVFDVGGTNVAVVRHEDQFYAFSGNCSHQRYSFDWTRVRPGHLIACSSHFSYFELSTGKVLNGPATEDLSVYEVRVEGEDVVVTAGA